MNKLKDNIINHSLLYIVPTPIGNLNDITKRALCVLRYVDLIIVENINRTKNLLNYFNIKKELFIITDYNEKRRTKILIERIIYNKINLALVSDSGTPTINDPGYYLICKCYDIGIRIIPLPGACAAITAISASGLPSSKFCYEGFLPKKRNDRLNLLKKLSKETRTIIFYESTHRILDSLEDMMFSLGNTRYIVLAKELTKFWETIYRAPIIEIFKLLKINKLNRSGEITLIVEGYRGDYNNEITKEILNTFFLLLKEISFKKAVEITSKIYNIKKNNLYKHMINKIES